MLLKQPGELVSREDLRKALWPNDTIVEFDHSINAAIQRLRDALGDSADNPRYVETLPRRGYRFIAAVEKDGDKETELATPPQVDTDLSGLTVGHFQRLEKIGRGGMGVVYRADDLKLGRKVALKFLPADSVTSPALLERFRREARTAAALSHPNICTIFGVEEHDSRPVIVMELVEGETLAARLERGALKLDQALALSLQIADALVEAHGKGVVHRDLKPANIMLGKSGAKVLDFGLAKIQRPVTAGEQTHTMTAQGMILGTVQYMSPEQAQGKDADARSDIFSFGLVLYEMITAKHAFEGSDPASILAAILERDAPALESEGLNRVVKACLAKEPADRFQTARDLKRAIEWSAAGDPLKPDARRPAGVRRGWVPWIAAAAVALAVVSAALVLKSREQPPVIGPALRFTIPPPPGVTLVASDLAISPDGTQLAFMGMTEGRRHVFIRDLVSQQTRRI